MSLTKQMQDNLNDILAGVDSQVALLIKYATDAINATPTDPVTAIAAVTAKFNAWAPKFKDAVTVEFNEVDTNDDLTSDLLA